MTAPGVSPEAHPEERPAPDGEHRDLTTAAASTMANLFKYETGTDRLVT